MADLTSTEQTAFDAVVAMAPVPGARLAALIDLHGHLTPTELRNVRLALDELPDAPGPVRHPRPER